MACIHVSDVSNFASVLINCKMDTSWNITMYHSKLIERDRLNSTKTWKNEDPVKITVMIANDRFCTGTKVANVHTVTIGEGRGQ